MSHPPTGGCAWSPAQFRSVGAVALVLVAVLVVLLVGRGVGSGMAEPAPATSVRSASPATKPAATRPARDPASGLAVVDAADLPSQARRTLALIDHRRRSVPVRPGRDGVRQRRGRPAPPALRLVRRVHGAHPGE